MTYTRLIDINDTLLTSFPTHTTFTITSPSLHPNSTTYYHTSLSPPGLKCILVDKSSMNVVLGHTMKLVAADLREILKICSSKLGPLMGEGAPYGGTKAAEKDILGNCNKQEC